MMIIIWINLAYNIMIINILYIMLLLYYYLNLLMCSSPVRTGCGQPGKGGDAGAGEWVTTEEGEKGTEDGERGNKVQKKRSERREMDEARVATTEQKGIWPTTKRALCCPEGSWGGGGAGVQEPLSMRNREHSWGAEGGGHTKAKGPRNSGRQASVMAEVSQAHKCSS